MGFFGRIFWEDSKKEKKIQNYAGEFEAKGCNAVWKKKKNKDIMQFFLMLPRRPEEVFLKIDEYQKRETICKKEGERETEKIKKVNGEEEEEEEDTDGIIHKPSILC